MNLLSPFLKITFLLIIIVLASCNTEKNAGNELLFSRSNLVAWCIVPFDSLERGPQERAAMLKELGITHFAYDWRTKHLSTFQEELQALKNNQIELDAIWFWITKSPADQLDSANQVMFNMIKDNQVKTNFWVGFSHEFFDGLTDEEKLDKGVESVTALHKMASDIGCSINLYNHGDWFGEPDNQIRIIEKAGLQKEVGIIYNFHHGHGQVKDFPALLNRMMPYLKAININGMKEGEQIVTVGDGDQEREMLKTIKASGYNGPIGILGHREDKDVKQVLEGNIEGLKKILTEMGETKALSTY